MRTLQSQLDALASRVEAVELELEAVSELRRQDRVLSGAQDAAHRAPRLLDVTTEELVAELARRTRD